MKAVSCFDRSTSKLHLPFELSIRFMLILQNQEFTMLSQQHRIKQHSGFTQVPDMLILTCSLQNHALMGKINNLVSNLLTYRNIN